jgi:hypothetical protein
MPVDVGVHDANGQAPLGQPGRQVHRHRRLAHAALTAGHRIDAGARSRLREGYGRLGRGITAAQTGLEFPPLFRRHDPEVDPDASDARHRPNGRRDVPGQLLAQWAAGNREQDPDVDNAVRADVDRSHHTQVRDRAVDLRVVDRRERGADGLFECRGWCGHAPMLVAWSPSLTST